MAKAPSESRIPTFGSRIPIPGKFRFLPNITLRNPSANVTQENKTNIVDKPPPEIDLTITVPLAKPETMSPPKQRNCNKTILLPKSGSENSDPNCTVTLDANSAEATFVMKCKAREKSQSPAQPTTPGGIGITAQDIGKRVCVGNTQSGKLKYLGEVRFNTGTWCGVELDEPVGKHDGCVKGVRYFTCRADCGILAPVNKVILLMDNKPTSCDTTFNKVTVHRGDSGPYSLLEVEDVRVNSNVALNCDEDALNKTLVWSEEVEQDLGNNVNPVPASSVNNRFSLVSCNLVSNDKNTVDLNTTYTPPSENNFNCECSSTPMSEAKKKYDSSSDCSYSPNNLNVTVIKGIDLHKTVNITPVHSPIDVPSLTKQNSFELDESLGILTPDQMIDFSSFMKNAGSASSEDLKSILAKHNERLTSTSRTPSSENLGSMSKDGFKIPLTSKPVSAIHFDPVKLPSAEDLKSLLSSNQNILIVTKRTEKIASRTPSSENLCSEIKNSVACDSSKICDESSLMILTPEQMEMSVFDSSKTPSSENLKSILCSNRSDKTISNSRTPSSENLGSLLHDGVKQPLPVGHLEIKEESLSLSRPCSIDLKSSSDPIKSLKLTASHQAEISSPNAVENSMIDFSLGLLEEDMLATGNQFSSMIDTTTNLELPLDSISGDKIEPFKSLSRSDQTPSPEDLPLDPIDPIKPVEMEIIEPHLLLPSSDSEPKTDVSKSTTTTKTNSFITSVTSITSLDTGYQGDGEMSRPASRGADHSPMAHKPNNPALVNLQWQRAIARRQDPMTDSDFFTESDADIHEENAPRGDRRAQVIDGNLYGANAQAPAAQDIFIGNQEEMDSSGVFTDLEMNPRADDFSDGERNRMDVANEDKSPSEISTKSITENSQEINKEPEDLDSTLINENQGASIMEVTESTSDKPKPPAQSVASNPSRKNVRARTETSKEENPSKKFKMPKRNVTSKVKTMMEQKQDIENQENRKPARKPTGRWDAVMNKISQGKEENKTKIRLKEVKSKVATGISGGPNTKRSETQKTETNTFAKPKLRRVRARGEVIGTTKTSTRASSSVHSSLSDLSISQLSHNNNKSSVSSVNRVTKKRETVGRCTPPVTEVLTPGGHKPTPVTTARTIASPRTREAQMNCKQRNDGLKSILKKASNKGDVNNENKNVHIKRNKKDRDNSSDENNCGRITRKKKSTKKIKQERKSNIKYIFKHISDDDMSDNNFNEEKTKLSILVDILKKKFDCTDSAHSDSDDNGKYINNNHKLKTNDKGNNTSNCDNNVENEDCNIICANVMTSTENKNHESFVDVGCDACPVSRGETVRRLVLKNHLNSTDDISVDDDTILDSRVESIAHDNAPVRNNYSSFEEILRNDKLSNTDSTSINSLKSILKNKYDDNYFENENINSINKGVMTRTCVNKVKFCLDCMEVKEACICGDSDNNIENVSDKNYIVAKHNRSISSHCIENSYNNVGGNNIKLNKPAYQKLSSSIPRRITVSKSNIILSNNSNANTVSKKTLCSANMQKSNVSKNNCNNQGNIVIDSFAQKLYSSCSTLQSNISSHVDVIDISRSLSKKSCDTDIPSSATRIANKRSKRNDIFCHSSLIRGICGSQSNFVKIVNVENKTANNKVRVFHLPRRIIEQKIKKSQSSTSNIFSSESIIYKNIYRKKLENEISKLVDEKKHKQTKLNPDKDIRNKRETGLRSTNINERLNRHNNVRRSLKNQVSSSTIRHNNTRESNSEIRNKLRSLQRRNTATDNEKHNVVTKFAQENVARENGKIINSHKIITYTDEKIDKNKYVKNEKHVQNKEKTTNNYPTQNTVNMVLLHGNQFQKDTHQHENSTYKKVLKDSFPFSYNESGLNEFSKLSNEQCPKAKTPIKFIRNISSPLNSRKLPNAESFVKSGSTEIRQFIKKSPPSAPADRRTTSRRPAATLPAKTTSNSSANRDQSRVTGVTPQKGGSPLRTQALPEKTPSVPPAHLLPQVQHSAKGVEALGVLVQYLVFNLDAFRTPSLKRELENIRTQWIKDKLELEETRMGYRRLEDTVSEQKILSAQTIEEERVKFRAEIAELFEKQRKDITELNERNKKEKIDLVERFTEENNELKNLLDLEISNRENEITIRIEAYVTEHKYRLEELEKENENLLRKNQTAVEILREENESIREQLDEKTSMIEDLKELKYINAKLKEEFILKERKFEEKIISAQDEVALLKEENKKILETFKSDTKDNKLQNGIGSPDKYSVVGQAALGRCTQLQDEVESLRTVLDLKLAELSELRRAHGELVQAAEELPAALIRTQSLQARVEDLELQIERKSEIELQLTKENKRLQESFSQELNLIHVKKQLTKENKRLQESFSQESKQNKRLTLHNEELQWKLKQNSEVVNAILQGQTPSRKSLHGSNQSLCDELAYKTPTGSFLNRTHHTSSFNEKHHGTSHILERTLSFRERTSHLLKDTPNRKSESQSPNERFDLDDSPPSSPKVKGVVEKSDSVSWVLDMDESPEVIASRMVRRAGSFRNVTPPKSTPTKSPASKRPRTKANNLSLSASAGAIVSPDDKNDNRYRSKSVSLRDSHSQSPEICHPDGYLSNSWHYSLRTSTPTKSGLEPIRSSVKLENNPDLEHDSDVAISLPALPSEINRKKENCSKPDSLPSLPSGDLLLLQSSFPKNSAGEAMISESNSEDECSSSTSERSPSASDTETSDTVDKCAAKSKLQYDLFLLTESATNSEAMDCSWSEDLEV